MPSKKARRLLDNAKNSKAGWTRQKLDRLYGAYGFIIENRTNHDLAKHPQYPDLRATLPRHPTDVGKAYVVQAVKLISRLEERESGK